MRPPGVAAVIAALTFLLLVSGPLSPDSKLLVALLAIALLALRGSPPAGGAHP